MFHFSDIVTITLTLFAVIDILGSIPVIVDLHNKLGKIHSERATLISGTIMVAFLFIGEQLLRLIGIHVAHFALAGAVIIFIVAMEMVLGREFFRQHGDPKTGSVVPLAFPLIAGAGTLTTLMSLRANYAVADILVSIGVNLIFVYAVLKSSAYLGKLLGPAGISILRRVFGIILLAIGIKIFITNLAIGLSLPVEGH
jgi:multiple antibiotic resistance protein